MTQTHSEEHFFQDRVCHATSHAATHTHTHTDTHTPKNTKHHQQTEIIISIIIMMMIKSMKPVVQRRVRLSLRATNDPKAANGSSCTTPRHATPRRTVLTAHTQSTGPPHPPRQPGRPFVFPAQYFLMTKVKRIKEERGVEGGKGREVSKSRERKGE